MGFFDFIKKAGNFARNVVSKVSNGINTVKTFATNVAGKVSNVVNKVMDSPIGGILQNIVGSDPVQAVKDTIQRAASGDVAGAITEAKNGLRGVAGNARAVGSGLAGEAQDAFNGAKSVASGIYDAIRN